MAAFREIETFGSDGNTIVIKYVIKNKQTICNLKLRPCCSSSG
jgi:hypothetical protein